MKKSRKLAWVVLGVVVSVGAVLTLSVGGVFGFLLYEREFLFDGTNFVPTSTVQVGSTKPIQVAQPIDPRRVGRVELLRNRITGETHYRYWDKQQACWATPEGVFADVCNLAEVYGLPTMRRPPD